MAIAKSMSQFCPWFYLKNLLRLTSSHTEDDHQMYSRGSIVDEAA